MPVKCGIWETFGGILEIIQPSARPGFWVSMCGTGRVWEGHRCVDNGRNGQPSSLLSLTRYLGCGPKSMYQDREELDQSASILDQSTSDTVGS